MMEQLVDVDERNTEVPLEGSVVSDVFGWEGGGVGWFTLFQETRKTSTLSKVSTS